MTTKGSTPAKTFKIGGVAHLEENMKSAEILLSDKELKEIEEAAR